MAWRHSTALLALLALLLVAVAAGGCGGGGGGGSVGGTESGPVQFLYVANNADDTVSIHQVNARTGQLRLTGHVATGDAPVALAAGPSGRFLYVANQGEDSVSAFVIDPSSGDLTPVAGSPFATGDGPLGIAVDPTGHFLYTANTVTSTIAAFRIDPVGGGLTRIDADPATPGTQDVTTGPGVYAIAVHPSGRFVYIAIRDTASVGAYALDPSSGRLTRIDADPVAPGIQDFGAGDFPASVAVDPSGRFAYVANFIGETVSAYVIDSGTGALTRLDADSTAAGVQDFPAGRGPNDVTVDPSGDFVYLANFRSSTVSAYVIDQSSGRPARVDADAGTPGIQDFAGTSLPNSVAVAPSGDFAYVANQLGDTVSAFAIEPATGALVPVGGSPFPNGAGTRPLALIVVEGSAGAAR